MLVCLCLFFHFDLIENSCELNWVVCETSKFLKCERTEQCFYDDMKFDVEHSSGCVFKQIIFFVRKSRDDLILIWFHRAFCWFIYRLVQLLESLCIFFIWYSFLFIKFSHILFKFSITVLLENLLHFLFRSKLIRPLLLQLMLWHQMLILNFFIDLSLPFIMLKSKFHVQRP